MGARYSKDGHLWMEKVLQLSPSMKGPLEKGMHMIVIRREAEEAIKMIALFCQEAKNAH